jgi:hypothetical protein
MGNHPDNQRVSDANQWPHHFNMLGQLLLGFIFMIVVFFLYDERGQFFPVEERISAFRGRRAVGQNSAASC